MNPKSLTVWIASFAIAACGGGGLHAFPTPGQTDLTQAQQSWPGTQLQELETGRQLYLSRCGSCHRPFEPHQLSEAMWPEAVTEMREQAKLDDAQVSAITKYIVTMSRPSP